MEGDAQAAYAVTVNSDAFKHVCLFIANERAYFLKTLHLVFGVIMRLNRHYLLALIGGVFLRRFTVEHMLCSESLRSCYFLYCFMH